MLVETMNAREIRHELITDFCYVQRKGKIEAEMLHRAMLRKRQPFALHATTYKTPRRNNWNLIFRLQQNFMKVMFYIKAWDKKGLVAYAPQFLQQGTPQQEIFIIKYSTHFFQRYNERMELGYSDTNKVMKHFFKYNFEYEVGQSEELEDGTMLMHFVFEEGLGIGWKDLASKTLILKTFIANATLNHKQQCLINHIKGYSDEVFINTVATHHLVNRF